MAIPACRRLLCLQSRDKPAPSAKARWRMSMLTLTAPETIAAYIRVSTYDQRTNSQREEISRWLKNHGIDPKKIQWFEDKETGSKMDRPAFFEMRRLIFAGEIKTLIVWKLDRLSRDMLDGITTLRTFLNQGVGLISV